MRDRKLAMLFKELAKLGTDMSTKDQLKNIRVPVTISAGAHANLETIANSKGLSVAGVMRQISEAASSMRPQNYYKVLAQIDTTGREI